MYWMIVPRIHGEGEPVTTRQADFHSECMRSLTEASPLIDPGLSDIYFLPNTFLWRGDSWNSFRVTPKGFR